jgi:hypothetical protein
MSKLFEAVIGNNNIPIFFWLVLDIPTYEKVEEMDSRRLKIMEDLSKGQLEGVKGISDTKQIVTEWFMMCRNAILLIDAPNLIQENDIQKIEYDNPEALCADDMEMLYRLFQKQRGKHGDGQLMQNVADYIMGAAKTIAPRPHYSLQYNGFPTYMGDFWKNNPTGINSVADLVSKISEFLDEFAADRRFVEDRALFTPEVLRECVLVGLKRVGQVYQSEGEWLVKSPHLHIPRRTIMMVGVDYQAREKAKDWEHESEWMKAAGPWTYRVERYQRLMELIEKYHLHDYYDIRFVDARKFEDTRGELMARRRKRIG